MLFQKDFTFYFTNISIVVSSVFSLASMLFVANKAIIIITFFQVHTLHDMKSNP